MSHPEPTLIIRPRRPLSWFDAKEVWAFRELLWFLTWRDIKVRYKQTVLGAGWALLQPLLTMVVFSIFFGRLAGVPSDGLPYPLFAFAGLVPWTLFAFALTQSSMSLVQSSQLVTKVYFPRILLPVSSTLAGVVDLVIALVVLLAMGAWYGVSPRPAALLVLPLLLALTLATATGVGLWLSAINAQFRDVRYTLPFITQVWLFLTPIAYPTSLLSDRWAAVYAINPMVGVVEGFRWSLLGSAAPVGREIAISSLVAVTLLVTGIAYFKRMERAFVDVL